MELALPGDHVPVINEDENSRYELEFGFMRRNLCINLS